MERHKKKELKPAPAKVKEKKKTKLNQNKIKDSNSNLKDEKSNHQTADSSSEIINVNLSERGLVETEKTEQTMNSSIPCSKSKNTSTKLSARRNDCAPTPIESDGPDNKMQTTKQDAVLNVIENSLFFSTPTMNAKTKFSNCDHIHPSLMESNLNCYENLSHQNHQHHQHHYNDHNHQQQSFGDIRETVPSELCVVSSNPSLSLHQPNDNELSKPQVLTHTQTITQPSGEMERKVTAMIKLKQEKNIWPVNLPSSYRSGHTLSSNGRPTASSSIEHLGDGSMSLITNMRVCDDSEYYPKSTHLNQSNREYTPHPHPPPTEAPHLVTGEVSGMILADEDAHPSSSFKYSQRQNQIQQSDLLSQQTNLHSRSQHKNVYHLTSSHPQMMAPVNNQNNPSSCVHISPSSYNNSHPDNLLSYRHHHHDNHRHHHNFHHSFQPETYSNNIGFGSRSIGDNNDEPPSPSYSHSHPQPHPVPIGLHPSYPSIPVQDVDPAVISHHHYHQMPPPPQSSHESPHSCHTHHHTVDQHIHQSYHRQSSDYSRYEMEKYYPPTDYN